MTHICTLVHFCFPFALGPSPALIYTFMSFCSNSFFSSSLARSRARPLVICRCGCVAAAAVCSNSAHSAAFSVSSSFLLIAQYLIFHLIGSFLF